MLRIIVVGNKEEIKKAKSELSGCCFINEACELGAECGECQKGKVEIEYGIKEDE